MKQRWQEAEGAALSKRLFESDAFTRAWRQPALKEAGLNVLLLPVLLL